MSFPRYERYKKSGFEWLGDVPQHWSLKLGRRLFAEKREPSLESDEQLSATQKYGVIPQTLFMQMEDQKVVLALRGLEAFKHVETDDFIISLRSFQGGIEKSHYQGCVSTAYTVLRAAETIAPDYWKYLFKSDTFISVLRSVTDGIREGKSISYDQFASVTLPIPALDEQQQIANFLDRETGKIDALIEEQRRLIALLKEKRQAVILHAVTKGLKPSAPMKDSGIEWIGEIPVHWNTMQLGRITISSCDGPFGSGLKSEHYSEEGIRVIRLQNIKAGSFDGEDAVYIDTAYYKTLGDHDVLPKDVLIAGLGDDNNSVGRACIAPADIAPAMVKADCFRFRLAESVSPLFVSMQLSCGASADGGRLSTGSTRSRISLSKMASRIVALPPLEEQEAIVDHLFRSDLHYKFLAHNAAHMIELLQERRSALISAAVTGKIDVRAQVAKPVVAVNPYSTDFARPLLAAAILDGTCHHSTMGRVKLQKLFHLCEYHAQIPEIHSSYQRQAAGPFDPQAMDEIRNGLLQKRWFEELTDGERYWYHPLEKANEHKQYLPHWADKQVKIDQILSLLGNASTKQCEIVSTLYAAWNDFLIEGKNPTDDEIIHEASSAETWHPDKEKIAADRWPATLNWMREKGLVPVGYGAHTTHQPDLFQGDAHEPA